MTDTLTLGGGIIYLKEVFSTGSFVDLGFCEDFEISVEYEEDLRETYVADALGNLMRVLSGAGAVTGLQINGSFSCQSISRFLLQKLWFRGTDNSAGADLFEAVNLTPIIRSLKLLSVPETGAAMCLVLPGVKLSIDGAISPMNHDWVSVSFGFDVVFDETADTIPTLRVQEEGESLSNFCT